MNKQRAGVIAWSAWVFFLPFAAQCATVNLQAVRDASMYSDNPNNSNGAGSLFSGAAGARGIRRTLIGFDLTSLPANAVIQSAQLQLNVIKISNNNPGATDFLLYVVTAPWAEGTTFGGGTGSPAAPGDATWAYNSFPASMWTNQGGDFVATASATTSMNLAGPYTWATSQMAADVQGWVANPASNNGWILLGGETAPFSAKEMASHEFGASGPMLTITYTTGTVALGNFWIGNDSTRGGDGTWSATGGTAWSATDADGQTGLGWDQTKTATFGGTAAASAVSVSGTVNAGNGMLFTQSGYTLSGGTINLGGATAAINTISVNSGAAVFTSALSGSNGMTKAGNGTLTINSSSSYSGGTQISAGTLRGTGTLLNTTVTTSSAGSLWPGIATVGSAVSANGSESLSVAGLDMSAGGVLKIALNTSTANSTQSLIVTGSTCQLGGTLSLGVPAGASSANAYTVLSSGAGAISGTFSTVMLNGAVVTGTTPVKVQYSASAVTVTLTGGVTPVKIGSFGAKACGAGVMVEWECLSEFQNLGFNVYRRNSKFKNQNSKLANGWTRVNSSLIAGRITNADAKTYRFYYWPEPGVYEYKLESMDVHGEAEASARLAGPVAVDAMAANALEDADAPTILFDNAASKMVPIGLMGPMGPISPIGPMSAMRAPNAGSDAQGIAEGIAGPSDNVAAAMRWFGGGAIGAGNFTAAKVLYRAPGVMLIPRALLPAGFDAGHVGILREGRAMPALALTDDGLLVYASGYRDDYTDRDAIFLRAANAPTAVGVAARAQGLFDGAQQAVTQSPATVAVEYHDVYFDYNLRPYTFAPWFSSQYLTDGTTQNFALNVPLPCGRGSPAALTVNLWSLTETDGIAPDHALNVAVNGTSAGQVIWSGGNQAMQFSFQIPAGVLINGANQIELTTPPLDGVSSQIAFLHSLSVSYTRELDGSKPLDVYNFGAQAELFEIGGVTSAEAWVVDARFPERAALIAYETQAQDDGTFVLRFVAPAGGAGHFVVAPAGQENVPLAVSRRQVRPMKATSYVATGPAQFGAGVQPLLAEHAKEGLRGAFVDQEQLFDYYNFGRYGPVGIQNAVRAARPKYLLLLGRTTYDYRNYSGLNVDPLCPTFLVSTTAWAQATSDSLFGDLGRGYPEVAVGRLPVNDESELRGAVAHVLTNNGLSSGFRVHAVADKFDAAAGDFASETDAIVQAHPDLAWQRNYLGVTVQTSPEVTAAMTDAANGGADVLLYVGHGNALRLGNETPRILDIDSVTAWTGHGVFLQSTCTGNWMAKDESGYRSIAIQALTQLQGGISASIGTSTYMNSMYATEFMSQLLGNAGTYTRWGDALLKTQQWAGAKGGGYYGDLMRTEQMFGDPAMGTGQK
ncbi:MAG TPA: C25 family cysteine peptidase [Planctomycetota bacterium]|nr:C25 family cysteine peptidase [Planctomycetota bacterium]